MKEITNFIYELSVLKKLPRSGSFIAGIRSPDTVGEHVFRATQLAFLLAELEGGNGEHASFIVSIHDNPEVRIGDHHKIMNRYIPCKEDFESQAFFEQISGLPLSIQSKMKKAFDEFSKGKTIEAICAKDADLLELAFEAKEMVEQGFGGMNDWITNIEKSLQTLSAQKILIEMKNTNSNNWWKELKK